MDSLQGLGHAGLGGYEDAGWEYYHLLQLFYLMPRKRVEAGDALHFVAPEDDAVGVIPVGYGHIHRVALHPEVAPLQG